MSVKPSRLSRRNSTRSARTARIARRVAAVAGAAGVAIAGEAEATGITYVPTAGVAAAKGIPGFSFTAPTTVTSGTLRPPASTGNTGWDVDGNGQDDFNLSNSNPLAKFDALEPFALSPNGVLCVTPEPYYIRNLLQTNVAVGPAASYWRTFPANAMTYNANLPQFMQDNFTAGVTGYFGFRFAFANVANQYYYGWASLTIDELAPGQGFRIGEAFYQTTPNQPITLGAVPVPVPEPSSMALLAAGAAGVAAWRARRKKKQPAAG